MNIKDFTEPQMQALLDLAMLAMYADGHLASAEDERVHRLLRAMGFATDYDCDKHYDASIARVSRHSQTAESARPHATIENRRYGRLENLRYLPSGAPWR